MSMLKVELLSKMKRAFSIFLIGALLIETPILWAQETAEFKKSQTGFYRDVFDQNIYYEGVNYFHLERFYRKLFNKKLRAKNVNVFDEVPDNTFFTNRHARKRLSPAELEQGSQETAGPNLDGNVTVLKAKFTGSQPGTLLVQDAQGAEYLLKFDSFTYPELATSSEVIASRFYHAIGYNIPEYSITTIDPKQLSVGTSAIIIDNSGFEKKLTQEKLEEILLFLYRDEQGKLRASARKTLPGAQKGGFAFQGRRKNDSNDPINHEERREVRALQVFASWLNNYRISQSNTMDVVSEENGHQVMKHYLLDLDSTFGAANDGTKPPMFSHEYLFDFGEAFKAFFSLGFWEKPWQKRLRDAGENKEKSPAVGYLDNRYFNPERFKTELPHYAFKDLTRADGFWAAKIIMSFSDEDIEAMIKAGKLTKPKDSDYLKTIVIERRDLIGKYWFQKANPIGNFKLEEKKLIFEDLAVTHGFAAKEGLVYHVDALRKNGKRGEKLAIFELQEPAADLANFLSAESDLDLLIRTTHAGDLEPSPYVLIEIRQEDVASIIHQD
ncbi:MAG: hypothetical protein HY582_02860 [Candidatus Omnitrophica bacterium]|nr:hypothetical protein [Candidatus Omnitrophota bacterium]